MAKVGIEISVNTDKVTELTKDMIKLGKKYGVEPLIMDNNYICFKLDDLIDVKSKGVINL